MAAKGIRDTEKVAVGAIRAAIQTWLAPQLSGISERLAHIEGRLEAVETGVVSLRNEMRGEVDSLRNEMRGAMASLHGEMISVHNEMESLRNEMRAEIGVARSEIRRLDNVADLRERLASVEAKLAARNG